MDSAVENGGGGDGDDGDDGDGLNADLSVPLDDTVNCGNRIGKSFRVDVKQIKDYIGRRLPHHTEFKSTNLH
ncbi:Hypothetical predicted protein [Octopus vulgaris]|uniref:Uncharacterized protein n=1 Tax=Octopus vulgaris TaxID=6645 RepID=A0AA36F2D0_OCTVU|nr:Hypothetical predicted protein [Octopus vulgaris]